MSNMPTQSATKQRVKFLFTIIFIGLVAAAWWQRQFVYDQIRLYGYTPPANIIQLATESTMNDAARRVFYVNRPEQKNRTTFSDFCPAGSEQSVVLGCYKASQRGIYLLDVTNAELAGIEQVTAAHELLHAEYDRLSVKERTRINGLLQTYYDTKLTNDEIKKTIDGYRTTEPNDVVNEMHSIVGTEATDLGAELEAYYARYFTDRATLVAYYDTYENAFTSRKRQIERYDAQLSENKQSIDAQQITVISQGDSLTVQRSRLNAQRNSGDIDNYNSQVAAYNAAADRYNANVRALQSAVAAYNRLVETRNAIAFEEQSLVESLSAPTSTQP